MVILRYNNPIEIIGFTVYIRRIIIMSKQLAPFHFDIVGSFLRPEAIKKARAEFKSGAITREDLKKVEDEEITKLVKKEVEHGLLFVTDGEFRRRWWHLDWLKEFDGFDTIHFTRKSTVQAMRLNLEQLQERFPMIRIRFTQR